MHLRYELLAGVLAGALLGVVFAGFVAAIPLVTRGTVFLVGAFAGAVPGGGYSVPRLGTGGYLSIGLLLGVLGLGVLKPRFWCRHVCPSGAVFSLLASARILQRTVGANCIRCGRCMAECRFDAVASDFTTRTENCTLCLTCQKACTTGAIGVTFRWATPREQPAGEPALRGVSLSRRGFFAVGLGALALAWGLGPWRGFRSLWLSWTRLRGARAAGGAPELMGSADPLLSGPPPVRPPGSVPEERFLRVCVRCGNCIGVCPTKVLQPTALRGGLEGLWTPRALADWAGCDPNCNNCGRACPTGAIRALPLAEKRAARMGRAVVAEVRCLPHAGREACQLCVEQCASAGYNAIEFVRVRVELDEEGNPLAESGFLAPSVLAHRCVGCGLCQARCHAINVREKALLAESAIQVEGGPGKEDRLPSGSYLALRAAEQAEGSREARAREKGQPLLSPQGAGDSYLPGFLR